MVGYVGFWLLNDVVADGVGILGVVEFLDGHGVGRSIDDDWWGIGVMANLYSFFIPGERFSLLARRRVALDISLAKSEAGEDSPFTLVHEFKY